jgi:hypothetical protein
MKPGGPSGFSNSVGGLQADLQDEIAQEIETPLGREVVADLDFEALEMAARRQALQLAACALEQQLNADTSDHTGPELPAPAENWPSITAATRRRLRAYWGRCVSRFGKSEASNG